jgi:hypothetical protein
MIQMTYILDEIQGGYLSGSVRQFVFVVLLGYFFIWVMDNFSNILLLQLQRGHIQLSDISRCPKQSNSQMRWIRLARGTKRKSSKYISSNLPWPWEGKWKNMEHHLLDLPPFRYRSDIHTRKLWDKSHIFAGMTTRDRIYVHIYG